MTSGLDRPRLDHEITRLKERVSDLERVLRRQAQAVTPGSPIIDSAVFGSSPSTSVANNDSETIDDLYVVAYHGRTVEVSGTDTLVFTREGMYHLTFGAGVGTITPGSSGRIRIGTSVIMGDGFSIKAGGSNAVTVISGVLCEPFPFITSLVAVDAGATIQFIGTNVSSGATRSFLLAGFVSYFGLQTGDPYVL